MADTTYVDGQQPLIYAAWLNDINNVAYRVLGSGGAVPTTVAQLLANLGLTGAITVGGNNAFTGTNSFAGPTTFTGATTFNDTATHEGTETFNAGSILDILGSLNVSGLASFTGTVALGGGATATTAAVGTNTTQVATTAFVEQYPALINNTSASSDITLAVGQGCYIDVAGATSIPLHVATSDNQLYELSWAFSDAQVGPLALLPNNGSITNMFEAAIIANSNNSPAASSQTHNSLLAAWDGARNGWARITTKTSSKVVLGLSSGFNASAIYGLTLLASWWLASAGVTTTFDTTTLWTSLGTLVLAAAVTGRIMIRRIA